VIRLVGGALELHFATTFGRLGPQTARQLELVGIQTGRVKDFDAEVQADQDVLLRWAEADFGAWRQRVLRELHIAQDDLGAVGGKRIDHDASADCAQLDVSAVGEEGGVGAQVGQFLTPLALPSEDTYTGRAGDVEIRAAGVEAQVVTGQMGGGVCNTYGNQWVV